MWRQGETRLTVSHGASVSFLYFKAQKIEQIVEEWRTNLPRISPSCLSRKFKLCRGSLWVLTHDTWYVLPSNWKALLSWEVKQYFWSSLKLLRQSFGSHNFCVFSKTVEGPLVLSAFIIIDIIGIYKFSSYLFWGDDLFSTGFNFLLHSGITCSCDQDCQPNTGRDRPTSRAIFRSTYRSVREK